MEEKIRLGEYVHYKGNKYRVIGVAKHSETLEDMVVYEAFESADSRLGRKLDMYVRPLGMFLENVEASGGTVPRFRFLDGQGEK